MKIKFILSTAMMLLAASLSHAADVSGRWLGKLGSNDLALNLKVEGKKLTGTLYTPDGDGPISNGKVSGNTISFTYSTNGVTTPYAGTLNGESLELGAVIQGKETKGTFSRVPDGQAVRITPRMRPQMTEYWEPVPKIVTPAPYPELVPAPSD
ncbi:MAG TPA: hypothetical protein VK658_04805, partial [Chryseolinea sp.]|nr:hypothetical protein [Chryseolinea sp.]